jgi:hypothetical protein
MTDFPCQTGNLREKIADRTGIIADYAFVVSDMPTRPVAFFEGWQGISDDCLTPKSHAGEC